MTYPVRNTRVSIINTTAKYVSRHGFWGMRLREIAQEENITEAGILYHFKSKEGLLIALLDYRDKVDRQALYARLGVKVIRKEKISEHLSIGLRSLTTATVERNSLQPEIVRLYTVLQGEALADNHPAYTYFKKREEWVMREYEQAADNDHVSDPIRTARQVLASMDGLQVRWLHNQKEINLVEEWHCMLELIVP